MIRLPDVALCGLMGTGKDFIGQQLIQDLGYTRIALADALKEEVACLRQITVEELVANKGKYRKDLQEVGVGRRQEDPDYWIKRWEERRALIDGPVVCTDTRFINEANYFRKIGAMLVKVSVPEPFRLDRLRELYGEEALGPEVLNHASEREVVHITEDYLISGMLPAQSITPRLLTRMGLHLLNYPRLV